MNECICEEGKIAGKCTPVGILRCHLLGRWESLFFKTVSFTHELICGQGTWVALWKVGTLSLLSEPRFCILNHTQHGGQGLSASPWRRCPRQPWWLGGQGSTGRQSTENKGTQEHELAKTRHARSFKKYILFLNSCQQFLQIFKPLEICSLFPLVFFLCVCMYVYTYVCIYYCWGIGPDLVRWVSCLLGRVLDRGTYFGAVLIWVMENWTTGFYIDRMVPQERLRIWRQKAWVLAWLCHLQLWFGR